MVSSAPKPAESQKRRSSDPISWYLSSIGRVPLLIELGNQVQTMMSLTEDGQIKEESKEFNSSKKIDSNWEKAKKRTMKANLQSMWYKMGIMLNGWINETLGYREMEKLIQLVVTSLLMFWWIRQRTKLYQSRTIGLPVELVSDRPIEKLA